MTDWESLSKQLKNLGVDFGKHKRLKKPPAKNYPIEEVISGEYWDGIFGPVFCHEEFYPRDYLHGNKPLWPSEPITTLCRWANAREFSTENLNHFIFLDTETSGLAGGTGTYAFEVGLARFNENGLRLVQFFMRHPGEEAALLAGISEFTDGMKAVVTYNGKAFDIPLLNTRYTMMGMTSPFEDIDHFDLLPLARRLWRIRLESRTLGNVEHHILGVQRSEEEVPGYMIPEMYFEYLNSGDAKPLAGIFYHNAIDVLSLAGLFSHMAFLLHDPHSPKISHGEDVVALARFFETLGDHRHAEALYQSALNHHLPEELYWDTLERFSFLLKRNEDWESAILLWEKAANNDALYAFEELAKFFEHRDKNLARAREWTLKGLTVLSGHHIPAYDYHIWKERLEHRLNRLNTRLSSQDKQ